MSSKPTKRESTAPSRRERRSVSPSAAESGKGRPHRSGRTTGTSDRERERGERRSRRPRPTSTTAQEMGWARPSKSPARAASSKDVASGQLKQLFSGEGGTNSPLQLSLKRDMSSRSHRSSTTSNSAGSRVDGVEKSPKSKQQRESFTEAAAANKLATATASSRDIDDIISQFRDHCDVHLATLLELKNNITTTEKAVVTSTEKDKEFVQVRKWYSALVEKHTKLQKEHQKLQEEHMALQEKYMNLKQASKMEDSFANFNVTNPAEKSKKDKKKNKKGLGEIVWQRAGNITNKLHQNQHQQLQ